MSLDAGTRIGVYEITGLLGASGMGEVYGARDTRLNRDVAIRVLPETVSRDPEGLARLTREAQMLATLNHPNIAQIYGFESSANALVMEMVVGRDLSAIINRRAMRLPEALLLVRQVAAALEAAHDAGVIHGDLRPANIKVHADNTVKVLDFGLATALDLPSPDAAYMSPEQARGDAIDRRSDIFAFGAVLYEMLSGQQLRDPIDWTALPRSTPATIEAQLARCLDRDVTTRLQAIREIRVTLDEAALLAETRSARQSQTNGGPWLAIISAIVIIAAIALWPMSQPAPVATSAPEPAPTARSTAVITKDPGAHDLYKRGLEAANASSEADLRRALSYFQQAIDRDPTFAPAYTGLARTYVFLADAYLPPIEAYTKARTAARAALAIDDRISDAHALFAYSTFAVDWDTASTAISEREFQRALDLDKNSVTTLSLVGTYRCFQGQIDEALGDLNRAAQLDPVSPLAPYLREFCDYLGQRYSAVIEDHRKTITIDPSFAYIESWAGAAFREMGDYEASLREYLAAEKTMGGWPQYGLALTYRRMGRGTDARDVMRRMDEQAGTRYVPSIFRAIVHADLGDVDGAVTLLEQAVDSREGFMLALRDKPDMRALVTDPRTRRILDRVDALRKK